MTERKKPYDLRERLLLFGKKILEICKKLPNYWWKKKLILLFKAIVLNR
jgi:hypothetical protein